MVAFINALIFSPICFYVSSKIFKIPINYKRFNYYLVIIINTIFVSLSFILTTHFLKVLFNYIILLVLNKLYFKKKFTDTIIVSFFVFVIIVISEMITAVLLVTLLKVDVSQLSESYSGQLYVNVIVSIIMLLLINIRKTILFFKVFSDSTRSKSINGIFPLIIMTICIYSAFFYYMYFQINIFIAMILSIALIIIISILLMTILKEKNYSINLKDEYEKLITNLNEYEKILEKYRITNHENINNFIVIKGMLQDNKKTVIKHIDEIINNKHTDDNEILFKTKKIPAGGLQGLVYQKMLIMKENKIICNLEISRNIDFVKLMKLDFELNKKLCTIVGVFIDNAVEAVMDLEKKVIGLYLYMEEGDLYFSISNNFSGMIDLDKIDNLGYSSKGKGRGYGLSLVKKITDNDGRISIQREIIKDVFKQTIKIKM